MSVQCDQRTVRVVIESDDALFEVPTVDATGSDKPAVEVQQRTDGPAAITKVADIQIPSEWRGEDIFEQLPFGADDEAPRVTVLAKRVTDVQTSLESNYQVIFTGWMNKIGSGGRGRLLRMRALDYAKLLDARPFFQTYATSSNDQEVSAREVLDDIVAEANKAIPVEIDYRSPTGDPLLAQRDEFDIEGGPPNPFAEAFEFGVNITRQTVETKSFSGKDNTIADAVNWIADQTGVQWYIEDVGGQPTIVFFRGNIAEKATTQAGGDIDVLQNQALFEIDPVNTLRVVGQPIVGNEDTYIIGVAKHEELLDRAGGQQHEKVIATNIESTEKAENKAINTLKEEIEGANEGSMTFLGDPSIQPYEAIDAYPVCLEFQQVDGPPLTYGTKRVTHILPATGKYVTEASVGIDVADETITSDSGIGTSAGVIEESVRREGAGLQPEDATSGNVNL